MAAPPLSALPGVGTRPSCSRPANLAPVPGYFGGLSSGSPKPAGEAGELRIIKKLEIYRNEEEKAYVLGRLEEITAGLRAAWTLRRQQPHAVA